MKTENKKERQFILENVKHLRKFYKTQKEFKEHLFSGEVTMPIPYVVNLLKFYK